MSEKKFYNGVQEGATPKTSAHNGKGVFVKGKVHSARRKNRAPASSANSVNSENPAGSAKRSKRFFLIGFPIGHSLSPAIYNAFFKTQGIDAEYMLYEIKEAEFEEKVRALLSMKGVYGFNVTQPYKKRIIRFLDGLSEDAAFLRSVNCVSRENGKFIGYNTDRVGFEKTLSAFRGRILGKDALVLGAGGVAPAVVEGLLNAGAGRVFVYNRTFERAVHLAEMFGSASGRVLPILHEALYEVAQRSAIIVNATTVGLKGEKSIIPESAISKGQILYDLIYNPEETDFLRIGRVKGALVVNGLPMLKAQADENLRIWGLKGGKDD